MQSFLGWLGDVSIGGIAAAAAGAAVVGIAVFLAWRRYNTPAERERRRRLHVQERGRITAGTLHDLDEAGAHYLFHYTYSVGGAEYSASQDLAMLREQIPEPHEGLIGSVMVKYDPNNAPNSLILCESWSGLRTPKGRPVTPAEPPRLATQSRTA